MAHANLVSLARTLKQIQGEDEVGVLFGGENNVESLRKKVELLLKFLEDLPKKVRPLEDRIRVAAYKLEDLIESHVIHVRMVPPELTDIERSNSLILIDADIQGLKSLIKCVDSSLEEAVSLTNIHRAEDLSTSAYTSSSASGSSRHVPSGKVTMVGLHNDEFIQIKDQVTGHGLDLEIISIVGMGGIGKTNLARNVYKDPLIKQHFDVRFWVTVTDEYHVEELLQGLLPNQGTMDECCAEMLIERVYRSLKGRRYLIVLDDLWNDGVWDQLRMALPNENNGSRIIVTSRLRQIALALAFNSSFCHEMRPLHEDQSWALLREKVYGQEHCPQPLEEIGKTIASYCHGLPLMIVVISGLLKFNKTRDFWVSVAEDINEKRDHMDGIEELLSLVYDNLPHRLKGCFLYMGIFPEAYWIPVNKLIKVWVAESFLKSTSSKSLEEVAEECVGELVNRNLIFVGKKSSSGRIKFCYIHDILRELSVKKGLEAQFFRHYGYGYNYRDDISEISDMQRRLIINTTCLNHPPDDIHGSFIRSLLFFPPHGIDLLPFASKFLLLKVLDGLEIQSECFPDEILDLVNLRYLAFIYSYASTCYVPASLSKLKNLQTLTINDTDNCAHPILTLFMPSEIWKMPQLRHLVLKKYAILPIPDSDKVGESYYILHNLQTLHVTNFEITKEVIERIPNLKKLRVTYLCSELEHWSTYCINNLLYLQKLQELNLEFEVIPFQPNISSFPQSLKKLTLKGSRIPWEMMSMIGSLPNLEVLKLRKKSFIGRLWEIIDDFSSLKHLEMESIDLEDWIVKSTNFSCLERLIIRWCHKLKEVPESIGDIATLQKLTITKCNWGVEDSVRKIQEQQRSLGNDYLRVHLVPIHR